VLGIDRAPKALPMARARAARAGCGSLRFADADLYTFTPDRKFDALIGRFVLMHIPDPVGAIRRLVQFLSPGAVVAFIEMDIDETRAVPDLPLLTRCIVWITTTYRRVGVEPNMGSQLYATFRAAGLAPELTGTTRIASSNDSIVFAFAAQTLASLLPKMEELAIATASEVDVATLADRLRQEAVSSDHCIMMPRLIGAWATSRAT
ncbi:MAG: class I SAM-dependent methyltransferase, partial [Bauldia sp.]|nr:class I SAM-dependent methyltransferase [Bauldia sp.]